MAFDVLNNDREGINFLHYVRNMNTGEAAKNPGIAHAELPGPAINLIGMDPNSPKQRLIRLYFYFPRKILCLPYFN